MRKFVALIVPLVLLTASPAAAIWNGYFKQTGAGTQTRIVGDFKVPRITCAANGSDDGKLFVIWIGLDGANNEFVEHAGITARCSGSQRVYNGWYENYPNPPVDFGITVRAGDRMRVTVTIGSGTVTEILRNVTLGVQRSHTANLTRPGGSVEFIAEKVPGFTPPCFSSIDFIKSSGFPNNLSRLNENPGIFNVGAIQNNTTFWVRDKRTGCA